MLARFQHVGPCGYSLAIVDFLWLASNLAKLLKTTKSFRRVRAQLQHVGPCGYPSAIVEFSRRRRRENLRARGKSARAKFPDGAVGKRARARENLRAQIFPTAPSGNLRAQSFPTAPSGNVRARGKICARKFSRRRRREICARKVSRRRQLLAA